MQPTAEFRNLSLDNDLWADYELIDSGGFEKLERFGNVVTRRPEPQALWPKALIEDDWRRKSDALFTTQNAESDKGAWQRRKEAPEKWWVEYALPGGRHSFKLKVSLSSFRHVGVFPEQATNWDYIYEQCLAKKGAQVLNLFAYTGGASLAACAAGAQVTHVDSIKQTVGWANENMQGSKLDGIRWMVEDALGFAKREVRRGRKYQGIILDPPAYGRGPNGEKWTLEEGLAPLMEACAELLDKEGGFLVLNLYSLGWSPYLGKNVAERFLGGLGIKQAQFGELLVGGVLPLGTYWRGAW